MHSICCYTVLVGYCPITVLWRISIKPNICQILSSFRVTFVVNWCSELMFKCQNHFHLHAHAAELATRGGADPCCSYSYCTRSEMEGVGQDPLADAARKGGWIQTP